ncbi:very short patch repair endonuclease [Sphingomonas crusticola]|uniref:very short patch repair endonuclease n=1 Tax=Sphingomonas crusticola TaxID=1697973 RepID=UPI000E278985|nr:very short patch repair endonuclease [Sphingomonas crusticola]
MRAVRRANTKPEMAVRRALHGAGYRFRLHRKGMAGTPDLVLPRYGVAIFVHGCFWHRHDGCSKATMPKTRVEFWQIKFRQNQARDRRNEAHLLKEGWRVLTVWECETRTPEELIARLCTFISHQPT